MTATVHRINTADDAPVIREAEARSAWNRMHRLDLTNAEEDECIAILEGSADPMHRRFAAKARRDAERARDLTEMLSLRRAAASLPWTEWLALAVIVGAVWALVGVWQ